MPLNVGSTLQDANEEPGFVYFVDSGMVSLVVPLEEGKEIEVGIVGVEGEVSPYVVIDPTPTRVRAFVQVAGRRDEFRSRTC